MEALMWKVREHKHNYAQEFGNVISAPFALLLGELINNPQAFTNDEKKEILTAYSHSVKSKVCYENLGFPFKEELKRAKSVIMDALSYNEKLFQKLNSRTDQFMDPWIKTILQLSLDKTDEIRKLITDIEKTKEKLPEKFTLRSAILGAFEEDNNAAGRIGHSIIFLDKSFTDFADVQVLMNKDDFLHCVIGNIIVNLHRHAFKNFDEDSFEVKEQLPSVVPAKSQKKNVFHSFRKSKHTPLTTVCANTYENIVKEKKVHLVFQADDTDEKRMNILIENNGEPFTGDTEKVFEKGMSNDEGTGIGLYSARQFLEAYGGTIQMYHAEGIYKVGFKINIPIL